LASSVLPPQCYLFVLAPQLVGQLFERGAFVSEDTARIAAVMHIAIF
jgi:peptidoglycan biosynthesis protein MviN/MurJ (putative lipid II flippase)